MIPLDVALPAGFNTMAIGRTQVNLITRYSNLSTTFLDISFTKVVVSPILSTVAQYVAIALVRRHLPYDPNSADAIQPTPTTVSSILSRPGAREFRQGNGNIRPLKFNLSTPSMRIVTFNTDAPSIFDVVTYTSVITTCTVYLYAVFQGVRADV